MHYADLLNFKQKENFKLFKLHAAYNSRINIYSPWRTLFYSVIPHGCLPPLGTLT